MLLKLKSVLLKYVKLDSFFISSLATFVFISCF